MKYIVFEVADENKNYFRKIPVMFPDDLVHRHVAGNMLPVLRGMYPEGVRVVNAGVCKVEAVCSGESETLNLKSDPHDSILINSYDKHYGVVA